MSSGSLLGVLLRNTDPIDKEVNSTRYLEATHSGESSQELVSIIPFARKWGLLSLSSASQQTHQAAPLPHHSNCFTMWRYTLGSFVLQQIKIYPCHILIMVYTTYHYTLGSASPVSESFYVFCYEKYNNVWFSVTSPLQR